MKKKMLIITLVMMLFAVQGYAQRERSESRRGHRTEQRSGYRHGENNRPSRRPQSVSPRHNPPPLPLRPSPPTTTPPVV